MKHPVRLLALGLSLAATVAAPLRAQPAQRPGYELLSMAADRLVPGGIGAGVADPTERLRGIRPIVERNAPALQLLREALQSPITTPRGDDNRGFANPSLSRFREMARQLRLESEVRLADGDFAGALDSRLTALELGAAITRGAPQIDALFGAAIEAEGRTDFAPIVLPLDAAQMRGALLRLRQIDARRATFAEVWEAEKRLALTRISATWRALLVAPARRARPDALSLDLTAEQLAETLKLTPETLEAQVSGVFDALIARDLLPFPRAQQVEISAPSQFVRLVTAPYRDSLARFQWERNILQNRLLSGALELRVIKLETGAYPATFAAPIDPFSDQKSLIYRFDGEKPRLYSIGPDGEDDGGTSIELNAAPGQDSAPSLSQLFAPQASGDVVAPVFSARPKPKRGSAPNPISIKYAWEELPNRAAKRSRSDLSSSPLRPAMESSLLLVLLGAAWAANAEAQPPITPPNGALLQPPAVDKPPTPAEVAAEKQTLDQIHADIDRERKAHAGSGQVEAGTGFYWLLRAAESLGDNSKPMPVLERNLTVQQQLEYDREFASHYAESLKLLRVALSKPIVRPLVEGRLFETGVFSVYHYDAGFRQLARALDSEANVRLADGDFAGALNSHLDCLDLGTAVSQGTIISMLVGSAAESIGRHRIEPVLVDLDSKTCRAAATRLLQIEAKRPAFMSNLRAEADERYRLLLPGLTDAQSRRVLETPEGRAKWGGDEGDGPTEAQARQFLALTPEQLRQNIERFYGAAITNAALPYQAAKPFTPPNDVDFQTAGAALIIGKPNIRFIYERDALQNRLLQEALQLRANKLESGVYPAKFDAGIDPFSLPLQPLIYRSDGKTYQLYSVGPDGRDNRGAAMQSIAVNETNGIKSLSNRLSIDALGDISAPRESNE